MSKKLYEQYLWDEVEEYVTEQAKELIRDILKITFPTSEDGSVKVDRAENGFGNTHQLISVTAECVNFALAAFSLGLDKNSVTTDEYVINRYKRIVDIISEFAQFDKSLKLIPKSYCATNLINRSKEYGAIKKSIFNDKEINFFSNFSVIEGSYSFFLAVSIQNIMLDKKIATMSDLSTVARNLIQSGAQSINNDIIKVARNFYNRLSNKISYLFSGEVLLDREREHKCLYCGGQIKGVIVKTCSNCGTSVSDMKYAETIIGSYCEKLNKNFDELFKQIQRADRDFHNYFAKCYARWAEKRNIKIDVHDCASIAIILEMSKIEYDNINHLPEYDISYEGIYSNLETYYTNGITISDEVWDELFDAAYKYFPVDPVRLKKVFISTTGLMMLSFEYIKKMESVNQKKVAEDNCDSVNDYYDLDSIETLDRYAKFIDEVESAIKPYKLEKGCLEIIASFGYIITDMVKSDCQNREELADLIFEYLDDKYSNFDFDEFNTLLDVYAKVIQTHKTRGEWLPNSVNEFEENPFLRVFVSFGDILINRNCINNYFGAPKSLMGFEKQYSFAICMTQYVLDLVVAYINDISENEEIEIGTIDIQVPVDNNSVKPSNDNANLEKTNSNFKKEGKEETFIFCRKCGAKLPQDSIFCTSCGTKVKVIQ